jgi:effector-binding domain-containing protein
MGERAATMTAQDIAPAGPAGGVYESEFISDDRGRATIFYPCLSSPRPVGRVTAAVIPSAELATTIHTGPHADYDRSYGALGAYVTRHALAVDGPIREYYLVGPTETWDESLWRTEIGWPIFETGPRGAYVDTVNVTTSPRRCSARAGCGRSGGPREFAAAGCNQTASP